jgi:hypothetical protein
MIRLLVQFKSNDLFGGRGLELLGVYDDPNKAVEDGLSVYDNTVDYMFINRGKEYLRIR